jgi:hypothetical protein
MLRELRSYHVQRVECQPLAVFCLTHGDVGTSYVVKLIEVQLEEEFAPDSERVSPFYRNIGRRPDKIFSSC